MRVLPQTRIASGKRHSADVLRVVIATNSLGFGDENRRLKKMYAGERLKAEIVAEPLTKKMVAPSQRREMAQWAVAQRSATIGLACQVFGISQTCYRYRAKIDAENDVVVDWLVRLTNNQRNWSFGLCFLYLRNIKSIKWNHKRVYSIRRDMCSSNRDTGCTI